MAQRRSGRSRISSVWAVIGVTLLAAVVVVLSLVALTQNRPIAKVGSTPEAAARAPESTPASTVDTPPPAEVTPVVVPRRVIAAFDSSTAARATTTACPAPTTIEVTGDAGATWEPFEVPGVSAAQRMTIGAAGFVSLIGQGVDGCAPVFERSFTGGEGWETAADELALSWFIDPANRAGLHSPSGDRAAPCGVVVQIVAFDENSAAVLCEDSSMHATADAGTTWRSSAPVPGAAAIAPATAGSYLLAVIGQNGCVGAQLAPIAPTDAALEIGAAGACLPATVAAGDTAVATSGDGSTWLWTGDVLGRSGDGGMTWS